MFQIDDQQPIANHWNHFHIIYVCQNLDNSNFRFIMILAYLTAGGTSRLFYVGND